MYFTKALAHCLAWSKGFKSEVVISNLQQSLPSLDTMESADLVSQWLSENSKYWQTDIGLIYGGATKIKSYLFESIDLQEIRGASALLDRINLVDLPALFHAEQSDRFPHCQRARDYCESVREDLFQQNDGQFLALQDALIPELIIYSTGGNILAFCPAELVDGLTNAIEKRYTTETLTANACVVGTTFKAAEIYLGLLQNPVSKTVWFDTLKDKNLVSQNPIIRAYFGLSKDDSEDKIKEKFYQRKGFSELTAKLASQFNQRRSGYEKNIVTQEESLRPSRRYPPMFETHPYLMRDDSDRRSAVVTNVPRLPDNPNFSEPTARKRRVGQITKRDKNVSDKWYAKTEFNDFWDPLEYTRGVDEAEFRSWVNKFEAFLVDFQKGHLVEKYDGDHEIFDSDWKVKEPHKYKREARSLNEIGDASNGFVAYIYADGNNMGAYIREKLKTPDNYRQFSEDVFEVTEQSVYWALAHHVRPHYYQPDAKSPRDNTDLVHIHPFEIITIGGDDVLLIVPANRALEVAKAIGERFEYLLMQKCNDDGSKRYELDQTTLQQAQPCHRYKGQSVVPSKCRLSMSSGVLITAANTPIYYADRLVSQLLKSAKKKAKDLRDKHHYGGTVDILTLKAVTMISSDINAFRKEGLTIRFPDRNQQLKLYATPYTLHELGGLIDTVQAIKKANFPRSQLYQIRSLLERGKRTAILNYRYFRVRLNQDDQTFLKHQFERAWCTPLDESNAGNLAPWMTLQRKDNKGKDIDESPSKQQGADKQSSNLPDLTIYETIWRELVDLYPFIGLDDSSISPKTGDSQNNFQTAQTETPETTGEVQT
ncbi:MAG: type III-B CRISPR-associated protein Cas10/Cmr2 [Symploca sp. SIO2B6]|nr:type III-B CRISPR-associated protein Cas10/Cmr2 [Symploca sp. SIO2B6]